MPDIRTEAVGVVVSAFSCSGIATNGEQTKFNLLTKALQAKVAEIQ